VTDSTPPSNAMPRPDGLPRRRKPAGTGAAGAASTASSEEALADLEAAAFEAELAALEESQTEPEIEETLRQKGLKLSSLEIARKIVDAAEDKKASDIVLLEVAELTSMADYFVICSGGSERQLGAIGDGIA
jgi:hypothetical protein